MTLEMKTGKGQKYATQLIGQAGVWRVSAELALRGHIPCFPGVDYGFDLLIENGLRLQVKTAHLRMAHPLYPEGCYVFDARQYRWDSNNKRQRSKRKYSEDADFFVLWGIEDNRFWIVSTSQFQNGIWFSRAVPTIKNRNFKRMVERRNAYEDRWDLLDVNSGVDKILEGAGVEAINKETH